MVTLTLQQQAALDELARWVPGSPLPRTRMQDTHVPGGLAIEACPAPSAAPSILQTWLGISQADLATRINGWLDHKGQLEEGLRAWVERRPIDSVFELLAAASLAFFAAEREVNPKIRTYVDAFYYISTCASVGYADMFPITQTGRAIASLVMIAGPALTNHLLERPQAGPAVVKTDLCNFI